MSRGVTNLQSCAVQTLVIVVKVMIVVALSLCISLVFIYFLWYYNFKENSRHYCEGINLNDL